MHFFVPFFFPSVVFLSSFSFLFCLIKVCGFTQCDIVCICFSSFWGHVLWLWLRVDFNFSARSPSPCFCPVGWMKRTKSNDLPSPSSKRCSLMLQEAVEIHILHPEWVVTHPVFYQSVSYRYVLLPIVWFPKIIQVQLDFHWGLVCKGTRRTL